MQDRIQKLLREEGMTATKFANEIGIAPASISHYLSGRNKPSADFLIKIVNRFRSLNSEWLLTGRGNMYKDDVYKADKNYSDNVNDFENIDNQAENCETRLLDVGNHTDNSNNNETDNNINAEESFDNNDANNTDNCTTKSSDQKKSKKISKLIVVYTDNTFDTYSPH